MTIRRANYASSAPASRAGPPHRCAALRPLMRTVHLASLRDPRLEEFPVGGGSNKLKVRLRIRNVAALPVLAEGVKKCMARPLRDGKSSMERLDHRRRWRFTDSNHLCERVAGKRVCLHEVVRVYLPSNVHDSPALLI